MKKYIIFIIFFICNISLTHSQNTEWIVYNTHNSNLQGNTTVCMALDSANNIWACTTGGIEKFNGEVWHRFDIELELMKITSIAIEKTGTVWIGNRPGVAKFDGATWKVYLPFESDIPAAEIFSIAIDDSNNKWFGVHRGIMKYADTTWTLWDEWDNPTFVVGGTDAIAIDSLGKKWIGTGSRWMGSGNVGVLIIFDGENWINYDSEESFFISDGVLSIAIDKEQTKWIATYVENNFEPDRGGLVKFDDMGEDTSLVVYRSSNSGLPDNNVYAVCIDDSGAKWLGTNGGLAKFDGESWTVWNTSNSDLPSDNIRCMVIDDYGNKWLGTDGGGVAVFNEGGVVSVEEPAFTPNSDEINCCPNPLRGGETLTLNYRLSANSEITVDLINNLGVLVGEVYSGYETGGSHTLRYTPDLSLPSGTYWLRATIGGEKRLAEPVVILK